MRIAISLVMDSAKSGAWRVIKNIILELTKIDEDNQYLIFVEKTYNEEFGQLPQNFKIVKVSITAKQSILNIFWHIFILPFHLAKEKVNILWLPWTSAAFLLKTKPTILSILDLTEYHLKNHYSKSRMIYRKAILHISSKLANKIITISEYTKNDIVNFLGIAPEKVDVLYCAPETKFKVLDVVNCRNYLKDNFGIYQPFILYVGQIQHPNKNIVALLHAFNIIKPNLDISYKLVLIGKEHLSSRIVYETVRQINLTEDVFFTGYVKDEDLPLFYNAASLFVYPSLYEGFGIPVTEAMACGCPVIASDTSSLPEVAGDAGILIDPNNIDEIAKAIIEVLNNSIKREEMIQKGFKQIKKFSWEDSAKKVLEIYEGFKK